MTQGTFHPVGQSEDRLFGPRKVLIHGLGPDNRQILAAACTSSDLFKNLPLVCPGSKDTARTLEELFAQNDWTVSDDQALATPFVIMAGLTGHELHAFMDLYKKLVLPRPIWATLTPTSATWSLADLLTELTLERQAIQDQTS